MEYIAFTDLDCHYFWSVGKGTLKRNRWQAYMISLNLWLNLIGQLNRI